jgi:hypothetical protein
LVERSSSESARGASRPFEASHWLFVSSFFGRTSNVSAFVDSKSVYSKKVHRIFLTVTNPSCDFLFHVNAVKSSLVRYSSLNRAQDQLATI